MKFSIKDLFSECDQIRRKLRIWSHLLKKSLMENFIFCAVSWTKNSGKKKEFQKTKDLEVTVVDNQKSIMWDSFFNHIFKI